MYKNNICIKYNSMFSQDELNEKMKVLLSNEYFGKYRLSFILTSNDSL